MTNMRSALYLQVSTTDQTVGNQRVELGAAAAARGRTVVATYAELGITGAAAPEMRPKRSSATLQVVISRSDSAMLTSCRSKKDRKDSQLTLP
jgi:Resolvase, N terminal domain